jgi:ferredoxin
MTPLNVDRPATPLAKLLALIEARAPQRFRSVVAQARRDMAVVEGRLLRGQKPSPLAARKSTRPVAAAVAPDPGPAPRVPVAAVVAAPAPSVSAKAGSRVRVRDGAREHVLDVSPGQFLLEAALEAGVNVPFSCTLGGCGTCKVHLESGDIEMEEPNCLTPDEIADGIRLICVGRAVGTECVVRVERDPS